MFNIGKALIFLGIIFIVTGFLFLIFPKASILRLPGDIVIKKDNFILYFPIVSSIVLSIILTIIFNLICRK